MVIGNAALQPTSLVWCETDYVIPYTTRSITVIGHGDSDGPRSTAALFSFTLQSTGGAASTDQQVSDAPWITWQIENGSAGKLTLTEHSSTADVPAARVVLQFSSQLYPNAVITSSGHGNCGVLGITAHGAMFCVDLDMHHGGLASVQEQNVRLIDLSSQWSSLGTPTCLISTPLHVVVGGSQGPVLCLPNDALLDPSASHHMVSDMAAGNTASASYKAFTLKESSWGIKSFIAGVWQRPRTPVVSSLMHIPIYDKAGLLLIVYDDGTLRGFSLARQTQLFADALSCCPPGRRTTPIYCHIAPLPQLSTLTATHAALVVQVQSSETLNKSVYVLQMAFPSNGTKPMLRQQFQCACDASASLVAAYGTETAVWLLQRQGDGSSKLSRYTLTGEGELAGVAVLLEHGALPATGIQQQGAGLMDAMEAGIWEEMLQQSSTGSPEQAAEAQVLAHILPPGALYRDALCTALRYHGIALTAAEVASLGRAELQALAVSAVDTIQARNPGLSMPRCWAQLLGSYQDAWAKMHPVLSLVSVPGQSEQVVTLRGGGVQGVLRAASLPEAVVFAGFAKGLVELPPAVASVQQAVQQLSGLLGAWTWDACVVQLVQGASPEAQLVPCLERSVLEAATPPGPGAFDDQARGQAVVWRRRRQNTLLGVASLLSSLPDAAKAIREYCHLLHLPIPSHGHGSTTDQRNAAASLTLFLTRGLQQVCASQARACLEALLLLRMVAGHRLPGGPHVHGQTQEVMSSQLVPLTSQLCRQAALVVWLTSSQSTAVHAWPDSDPALAALASLHLGSPPKQPDISNTTANHATPTRGSRGQQQQRELSLAARLLPKHLDHMLRACSRPGEEGLLTGCAVQALAAVLQYGAPEESPEGGLPIHEQMLQLGYQLFVAREHTALAGIARLALGGGGGSGVGGAGADAGLHLLEGLSMACTLRDATAANQGQAVAHASACFFRAAAGMHAGASALLLNMLHDLTQHLTGSAPPEAQPGSISALQLQLFEAAMQVFEREGAPDGALTFARAALQHCSTANSEPQTPQATDMDTDMPAPPSARTAAPGVSAARLWSNVFTYCCQLRRWHDAYAALVSNPDPQQALDCLRRLVHELSDAGELGVLCGLPLAGALLVPDEGDTGGEGTVEGTRLVTLKDEAVAALQRKALNSELSAHPQPYRVLYAFLVSRHEYRQAASTMAAYSWRMRTEGSRTTATIQETLLAYELSMHCLSVVCASEAWLDTHTPWLAAHMHTAATAHHALALFSTSNANDPNGSAPLAPHCLTLDWLRREHAVLRAAAQVHATGTVPGLDPLRIHLDPDEVLRHLLLAGRYEDTLALAHAAWTQSSQGQQHALEQIVSALAETAARMQLQGGAGAINPELPKPLSLLSRDPQQQQLLLGCTHLLSPAGPLWSKLRALLVPYVQRGSGSAGMATANGLGDVLRVAAADAVLRTDRNMSLPVWLLQLFTEPSGPEDSCQWGMAVAGCGPASLLELFLRHDRLADGVALVVGALAGWGWVDARQRQRHAATWFSHTRIKVLRGRLVSEVERGCPVSAGLLSELDEAMVAHVELLASDAAAMMQMMA